MTGFNFRYLLGSQPKILYLINLQRKKMFFLNEFVETLNKLETLTLSGCIAINMFLEGDNNNFNFKLKILEINMSGSTEEPTNQMYVIKFLRSQASSLEELSLRSVSGEIYQALLELSSLHLLKKLQIYSAGRGLQDSFPENAKFYDSMQPLRNLKELILEGLSKNEIALKGILQHCPSLESLMLRRYLGTLNIMPVIAANNSNVQHLELPKFADERNPTTKLKSLKSFHLTAISEIDVGNVTSFLSTNPTIERIVIERSHIKPELPFSEFVQTLIEMPNLKYLEFNGVANILKVIYDRFTTPQYDGTISLVLCFDRMGLGTPRVTFNIPQEEGQWDTKCGFVEKFVRTPRTDFLYRLSH